MACSDGGSEWHTCPALCCYNRQRFALAALLSFSILIEWRTCKRGRKKSVTPLSRVITSFHPIERHSIHPLSADNNSARQAGQKGRGRRRGGGCARGSAGGGKMKREGWPVWRQGNEENKKGRWWAGRGERV